MSDDNGTKTIWIVFWILLILTTIEVLLGIYKPISRSLLNLTFIVMTLVKAYYIVAYFMHLKHERGSLIKTISLPCLILIPYLLFILLTEAGQIAVY